MLAITARWPPKGVVNSQIERVCALVFPDCPSSGPTETQYITLRKFVILIWLSPRVNPHLTTHQHEGMETLQVVPGKVHRMESYGQTRSNTLSPATNPTQLST